MKKRMAIFLSILCVVGLVACKTKEVPPEAEEPGIEAAEEKKTADDGKAVQGTDGDEGASVDSAIVVPAHEDVAYASVSDSQVCDIYLPEGAKEKAPVIVLVHGGGFKFGDQKMGIIKPVIEYAVGHGYAVVSVDYRKSGEAVFPAALSDVKAAVRFVKAKAGEYGFDVENITLWGESAGAYLSLMTALTPEVSELDGDVKDNASYSSSVNALVDFYGPVEFYTMREEYAAMEIDAGNGRFESDFLGVADIYADKAACDKSYWETYKEQMPSNFALKAWVQVGDENDANVPYTQSENFAARLKEVPGATVSYSQLPGAGHEDDAFYTEENLARVFAFLEE